MAGMDVCFIGDMINMKCGSLSSRDVAFNVIVTVAFFNITWHAFDSIYTH